MRAQDEESANPFDSLESSYEYVCLLQEALEESRREIEDQMVMAMSEPSSRRVDALSLVRYKLTQLAGHLLATRRILNDLRALRRILLKEPVAHSDRLGANDLRT